MLSRVQKFYVIWQRPDGTIYHKLVSGHYCNYYVGLVNGYGHEVIYIINNMFYSMRKPPFKLRFKRKLINYIEKM